MQLKDFVSDVPNFVKVLDLIDDANQKIASFPGFMESSDPSDGSSLINCFIGFKNDQRVLLVRSPNYSIAGWDFAVDLVFLTEDGKTWVEESDEPWGLSFFLSIPFREAVDFDMTIFSKGLSGFLRGLEELYENFQILSST